MKQDTAPTLEEAIDKAERYCVRAERSERDILRKCYDWRVDVAYHAEIVAHLRSQRYLDDERFALAFTRDKHRFSGWGRQRLRQELRQHRIPEPVIAAAFAEVFAELDEDEQLRRVLETKCRQLKSQDPVRKRLDQLIRHGLYRGYSYERVRHISEQLIGQALDND
ncbi:MAG: regulatory protein RecX [Porphyromonas sp.]|nr:regulatory protein RecX [Porphyromonas sp.]